MIVVTLPVQDLPTSRAFYEALGRPVDDRPQVDDLVAKALAAGGTALPAQDDETTHTGNFADPEGHVWQIARMDQLHVVN